MDYLIGKENDKLLGALIGLVRSTDGNEHLITNDINKLIVNGLINIKSDDVKSLLDDIEEEKRKLVPSCYECMAKCGRTDNFNVELLLNNSFEIITIIKSFISSLSEIAKIYNFKINNDLLNFIYKSLFNIGLDDFVVNKLKSLTLEAIDIIWDLAIR